MRKRRGRGEGSIQQRKDGLWAAVLTVGYDERGKRKRRSVYGKTKQEVMEKLSRLQGEVVAGTLTEVSAETIADFLQRWLADVAKPRVRANTHRFYSALVRNHINQRIGGVRLSKLTPLQVQALHSSLQRDGGSARLRQQVHLLLHGAFKQAVRWGLLSRNPCDAVDAPRVPRKAMRVLTQEQTGKFLAACAGNRLEALYVLALTTGLRQGELLGLQWSDADLKARSLMVRQQLQDVESKPTLVEPKSDRGRRRIDLPEFAVKALKRHKETMLAEGNSGSPFVFCDTQGGPIRKSNLLRRSFWPLLKKAGLPPEANGPEQTWKPGIRFHDLRHTAATLMLSENIHPKVVQERLGHASIALTLDTYSHAVPSMQKAAAETMDAAFTKLEAEAKKAAGEDDGRS